MPQIEHICRQLEDKDGPRELGNKALALLVRGDLDGAMALIKKAEGIYRDLGDKDGLAETLGNQSHIFKARGDRDSAFTLLNETERLFREVGNKDGL